MITTEFYLKVQITENILRKTHKQNYKYRILLKASNYCIYN